MSDHGAGYQAVFRERWRERQSTGNGLGSLIRQPRWMDAGLVGLGVLLVVGGVAAASVTVPQTAAFPAVVVGTSVSAVRLPGPTPDVGAPAEFRDATGAVRDAVVVEVAPTTVSARLTQPGAAAAGQLLVQVGRKTLFEVLAPGLG